MHQLRYNLISQDLDVINMKHSDHNSTVTTSTTAATAEIEMGGQTEVSKTVSQKKDNHFWN